MAFLDRAGATAPITARIARDTAVVRAKAP
jgi:hypothetical protein